MANLSTAISKLRDSGLCAAESQECIGDIVGGAEYKIVGEVGIFKDGFSMSLENGSWIVRISGVGQMIDEFICVDLNAAVELVLAAYKERGVVK